MSARAADLFHAPHPNPLPARGERERARLKVPAEWAPKLVEGKFLVTVCALCGGTPAPFGFAPFRERSAGDGASDAFVFKPEEMQFGAWACTAHRFDLERLL